MDLFISKFLPLFVYPLGLAFFLVAAGLFLYRRPRWQRFILVLALLVLWLGGNRWVALGLARSLEWRYLPSEPIPQAGAIVLLGGGTEAALYPRSMVEVNSAGDRVLYAAWLYHQGKAPNILISGRGIAWLTPENTQAQDTAQLLEMMDVPLETLWLESDSRNTYENAVFSRQILADQGVDSILLVTSASHMPRSVRLFEAQGLEVIPVPADFKVTEADWQHLRQGSLATQLINLVPSVDNLSLTTGMLKEYIGILFYELRGWK